MSVVCDASVVVAALTDVGAAGQWAVSRLYGQRLAVPALLPVEVANALRRLERASRISPDQAAQAHADMLGLAVELWPYEALADRVWMLRANLTAYDACYVALAERLGVPLLTLDAGMAGTAGSTCDVVHPGGTTSH